MKGPLGGQLIADWTAERLAAGLVYEPTGVVRSLPQTAGVVDVVSIDASEDGDDGTLGYDRPLPGWTPLLSAPEPLVALAQVADALAALHAGGIVHGDLGPRMIGWRRVRGDGGAVPRLSLLVPARSLPGPGALARALVLAGVEPLASTAYLAPEVLAGAPADAAADVYALAAMVHRVVSGAPPLGQLETLPAPIRAALSREPARRPKAAEIAAMLRAGAPQGSASPPASLAPADLTATVQAQALRSDSAQMSTMLLVLLVLGGAFVFFGAIWLVTTNWGALGEAGHFVLLLALTGGAALAGRILERRGYDGTGLTLTLLASRLLWADAAYLIDVEDALSRSGAWSIAAGLVSVASALLLVVKRGPLYAWMAALDLAIFAGCLGDHLSSGNPLGPALYAALVAVAFAACALVATLLPPRASSASPASDAPVSLGLPCAVFSVIGVWISAIAALFLFSAAGNELFATAWPYALLVVPALVVARAPTLYRWCGAAALVPLLLLVPSIEALVQHEQLPYLVTPIVIGFVILGVLASSPAHDLRDLARAVLGVTNVAAAPTLLFLVESSEHAASDAIGAPLLPYFAAWAAGALGMSIYGYVASGRAVSKPTYRLVELTGLIQFFGTATVLSLFHDTGTFYPALVFVTGAVVLVVALVTRRASLLFASAIALLVNLSLQYFIRLNHLLPTAVLIIGFGVVLLGLGLAYERRLKRLLPLLRAWR
jgi:hypothetical protein